jgi:hypothetical protein
LAEDASGSVDSKIARDRFIVRGDVSPKWPSKALQNRVALELALKNEGAPWQFKKQRCKNAAKKFINSK